MSKYENISKLMKFGNWYNNPDEFFHSIYNKQPYSYQKRILKNLLKSKSRIIITAAGQTGKTILLACIALWYATVFAWWNKTPIQVIIISGSKSQARHLYEYCRDAILNTPEINELVDGEPLISITRFRDGSIIRALSTSLKDIHGKGGDIIIIDEAVLAGDFIMKDSLRMITDKPYSKIIFSSTPQSVPGGDLFLDIWENSSGYPEWQREHWSARDCPHKRGLMEEAKKYGDYIYDVFWLGKPHPLTDTMLPPDKLRECIVKNFQYNSSIPCEMGIDWGFGQSATGIVVRQKIGNVHYIIEAIERRHSSPVDIAKLVQTLVKNYHIVKIKCDAENKSENMRLAELGLPVVSIPFNRNKGLMQGYLRNLFTSNNIRLKEEFVVLNWQLRKYKWDTKKDDDLVDALMLACYEEEHLSQYSPLYIKTAKPKIHFLI